MLFSLLKFLFGLAAFDADSNGPEVNGQSWRQEGGREMPELTVAAVVVGGGGWFVPRRARAVNAEE